MGYFNTRIRQLERPVFIAEIGVNHNGDVELAKRLIEEAKAAGADVAKFQSFQADKVACRATLSTPHIDASLGVDGNVYHLLQRLSLSYEQQTQLKQHADALGILFASTPFSLEDIDFLASLEVPFLKIGSSDVTTPQILTHAARTRLPILLSTGMCSLPEIADAIDILRISSDDLDLALLHCVSLYPPQPGEVNLRSIPTLASRFPDCVIGFSDHTIGTWAVQGAVALGACVIEKHFTLDTTMPGPDQAVSADPTAFRQLVDNATQLFASLGLEHKQPSQRELGMRPVFRRSLVTTRPIAAGETLTRDMLTVKRPGTGMAPGLLTQVLGQVVQIPVDADVPFPTDALRPLVNVGPNS